MSGEFLQILTGISATIIVVLVVIVSLFVFVVIRRSKKHIYDPLLYKAERIRIDLEKAAAVRIPQKQLSKVLAAISKAREGRRFDEAVQLMEENWQHFSGNPLFLLEGALTEHARGNGERAEDYFDRASSLVQETDRETLKKILIAHALICLRRGRTKRQ